MDDKISLYIKIIKSSCHIHMTYCHDTVYRLQKTFPCKIHHDSENLQRLSRPQKALRPPSLGPERSRIPTGTRATHRAPAWRTAAPRHPAVEVNDFRPNDIPEAISTYGKLSFHPINPCHSKLGFFLYTSWNPTYVWYIFGYTKVQSEQIFFFTCCTWNRVELSEKRHLVPMLQVIMSQPCSAGQPRDVAYQSCKLSRVGWVKLRIINGTMFY